MKCSNCKFCSRMGGAHLSNGKNIWCKHDHAIYERGYGCDFGEPSFRYLAYLKNEKRKAKRRKGGKDKDKVEVV